MKNLPDKYYKNLTSRQRFIATWEAIGRDDEVEKKRLMDTTPSFSYSAADHVIRDSWDSVIAVSLGVEADIRGYALECIMELRSGETDLAISSMEKIKTLDASWNSLLQEIGLSHDAIRAARPQPHPFVEHLLSIVQNYEPENDPGVDDYFGEVRRMIPLLQEEKP